MGITYLVYKDDNWIQLVWEGPIAVFCINGFKNGGEIFY
jgi:hypothetical protein